MKILHVSGARSWGGNEQQLVDVIHELEKIDVKNIIFGVKSYELHQYSLKNNIDFIACKESKLNKFKNYKYLKVITEEINPDLIHLHTSDSVTVYTLSDIIYRLKTPAVFSKKGMGKSMSFLSRFKYNYRNIKKIVCVSEAVKKSMLESVMKPKNVEKLAVVYDGININRMNLDLPKRLRNEYSIDEEKFLIGNIANHSRAKDLGTLIKAIHYLVNDLNFKQFHVFQIGSYSTLTEDFKKEVSELSLDSFITFTNFKDQATSYLNEFDIYVMSSEREGLPLTIYEAFYKKIPVVSTKAGGIPEVITDGENGFLVEIHDYKNLANKIKKLLLDKSLQNIFKESSYNLFSQNFEASKTAENTKNIYKSLM